MDEAKELFVALGVVTAFFLGCWVPSLFIGIEYYEDKSVLHITENLIRLSIFFFAWCFLSLAGNKYPKLSEWMGNTSVGMICVSFLIGFFITCIGALYMLLPLFSWLHLGISIVISLVATICVYITFPVGR